MGLQHVSRELMQRCDALGAISDEPDRLTRTFHSPAMQRVNAVVGEWMRAAGLDVRVDAAFNLMGRWPCAANPAAKTLLLGGHLDTVRGAGKYDGILGVLTALAAVEMLKGQGVALPFHVEIIGFSDEEGTRYQTTYLGSRAVAGTLSKRDLDLIEEKGIERAKRRADEFLAYVEAHIEQGPVLEAEKLALGVVTGIAGQTRVRVGFTGKAGTRGNHPDEAAEGRPLRRRRVHPGRGTLRCHGDRRADRRAARREQRHPRPSDPQPGRAAPGRRASGRQRWWR